MKLFLHCVISKGSLLLSGSLCAFYPTCLNQVLSLSLRMSLSEWDSLDQAKLRDCEEYSTVSVFLLFSVAQTSNKELFFKAWLLSLVLFTRSRSL